MLNRFELLKTLRIVSVIGIFLSTYATFVEVKAEFDEDYEAYCDINAHISCSAAFTSLYGRGFGVLQMLFPESDLSWIPRNGEIGILFYSFIFISSRWHRYQWLQYLWLILAVVSNLLSIYLALILLFALKTLCLVCVCVYVVNFACLRNIWLLLKSSDHVDEIEHPCKAKVN